MSKKLKYKYRNVKFYNKHDIFFWLENCEMFHIPEKFVIHIGKSKNGIRRVEISKDFLSEAIFMYYDNPPKPEELERLRNRFLHAKDITWVHIGDSPSFDSGRERYGIQYIEKDWLPGEDNILQEVESKDNSVVFTWKTTSPYKLRKKKTRYYLNY